MISGSLVVLLFFQLCFYLYFSPCVFKVTSFLHSEMWHSGKPNFMFESGELPLMRDLPMSTGVSSLNLFRNPVASFSTMPKTINNPYPAKYEGMKRDHQHSFGRNCRDNTRGNRQAHFIAQHFINSSPRRSWDLGRETYVRNDGHTCHLHQQRTKFLDKLEILDDIRLGKHLGSCFLNWEHGMTDGDFAQAHHMPIREEPLDAKKCKQDSRQPSYHPATHRAGFLASEEDDHPREEQTPHKPYRISRAERLLKQRISSLVEKSHNSTHGFSQCDSVAPPVECHDEKENNLKKQGSSGLTACHGQTHPKRGRRPRHTTRAIGPQITSAAEDSEINTRSYPQNTSLENGTDSSEMTKDRFKSPHRCKNDNKPPQYDSQGQDVTLSPEHQNDNIREHDSFYNWQSMLQTDLMSPPFVARRNKEPEPLPLLTEIEDYNDSDGVALSSLDGDATDCLPLPNYHGIRVQDSSLERDTHDAKLVKTVERESAQLSSNMSNELALSNYHPRSLSQKYRPKLFEEVVGQNTVTHGLCNAILRRKIAPVYLFHGSRGTGKTTVARIFAAALTCISSEEQRPCTTCKKCASVAAGKCSDVKEVDAASNNGIAKVKMFLEETPTPPATSSRYKVFIIDECHVLTSDTWNGLLKILEEPPINVVFILITTDPDQLPRTAVSRCQRFPFPKIKEFDIVRRLQQLVSMEGLEIGMDTLHIIASQSDGSLRDAETTLDQLSLFGKQMSSSAVYELVGSASDDSLLDLLNSSLMADIAGTVQRARALVDSGLEPLSLMSRLAALITDILVGSYNFTDKQKQLAFFHKQNLSEDDLEQLRMAMKILSDTEKQLRDSNDRRTWLTAALLQLGPNKCFWSHYSSSGTSAIQSPVVHDHGPGVVSNVQLIMSLQDTMDNNGDKAPSDNSDSIEKEERGFFVPYTKGERNHQNEPLQSQAQKRLQSTPEKHHCPSEYHIKQENKGRLLSRTKLEDIWFRVLERCSPSSLKQLLQAHGKLITISMSEVDAVVYIEVNHKEHKTSCEKCHNFIAQAFESILCFPVKVQISLANLPEQHQLKVGTQPSRSEHVSAQNHRGSCDISEVRPQTQAMNVYKHEGSNTFGHHPRPGEAVPEAPQTAFTFAQKTKQLNNFLGNPSKMVSNEDKSDQHPKQKSVQDGEDNGIGENHKARVQLKSTISEQPILSSRDCKARTSRHKSMDQGTVAAGHGVGAVGRRSSHDIAAATDQQRKKVNNLTMVRRLTLKSRILTLPNSGPTSPDSSTSTSRYRGPNAINNTTTARSQTKAKADSRIPVAPQAAAGHRRGSLLKEAAGTFARFFKGNSKS